MMPGACEAGHAKRIASGSVFGVGRFMKRADNSGSVCTFTSGAAASSRASSMAKKPAYSAVRVSQEAGWDKPEAVVNARRALRLVALVLRYAAICHDKKDIAQARECIALARPYLVRYCDLAGDTGLGSAADTLRSVSAEVVDAVVCYHRGDGNGARKAVARATNHFDRFLELKGWDKDRKLLAEFFGGEASGETRH